LGSFLMDFVEGWTEFSLGIESDLSEFRWW